MTQPTGAGLNLLTVAEVATLLRVSKMSVYRLIHNGELEAVRFWRYRPAMCNGVPTEAEAKVEFSSR